MITFILALHMDRILKENHSFLILPVHSCFVTKSDA